MKKTSFVCKVCGFETPKWLGKCPSCGTWGSLVERKIETTKRKRKERKRAELLKDVVSGKEQRETTGIFELDRVLGGGIVKGSLILIGGDPGIGKSTLTLQISGNLAHKEKKVLYVTGEESSSQVKLRAERLSILKNNLFILPETELESILEEAEELSPSFMIIDSIQTIYKSSLPSSPGSVGQVKECTSDLLRFSKERGVSILIVGHVTKIGAIAGPKTLEHMVDTVLYFEGDKFQQYRILRAAKNRFGSTNEVGIFEMTDRGLVQVENPSEFFLSSKRETPGSVAVATIEGTRPLLIEIQALTTPTVYSLPQRLATGFNYKRLSMLLCILEERGRIRVSHRDVYLNIVGGLWIEEPAVDLGIIAAVGSSVKNIPIPQDIVIVGEAGLSGEIRPVSQIEARIKEAERLGFKRFLLPKGRRGKLSSSMELIGVDSVREALRILLGG